MNFIRRMVKVFVDSDFDRQMERMQNEQDRLALARRDELQSIYREIEGARDLLDESKPLPAGVQ